MTRLVLVQRMKKENGNEASLKSAGLLTDLSSLAGKTVYVQGKSPALGRLRNLGSTGADSVTIVEVPYDQEQLIKLVAEGEIDFTVCDENIARVNVTSFPWLDISVPLSEQYTLSWAVRKNGSVLLRNELDHWLAMFRNTKNYEALYSKYFLNRKSEHIVSSDYYALNTGRVSPFDDMIRQYSALIKWDWRLLASLIFQESRFEPDVESYSGAYGLMQIMPVTGKNFGIDIRHSPETNIKAGIEYIIWLHSIFDTRVPDKEERLRFILASYNAGPGHIIDAMNLARKNGMDPAKWDGSVSLWLARKAEPRYYNDAVVRNGYYKGQESVNFVSQVLNRWEHYKNVIPAGRLK